MATKLDLALAQFLGFHHGKWNRSDVLGLVEGMGLTKREWTKIRNENINTYLSESEIQEIDNHFSKK